MKERPILFGAPMVRALLDGSKTQTRRVMKPQPEISGSWHSLPKYCASNEKAFIDGAPLFGNCPFGKNGDYIWVREAHWFFNDECDPITGYTPPLLTVADVEFRADGENPRRIWRPSIFMPRWASRITLEITGVCVERLQDINRGDAMAEGCPFPNMAKGPDPRKWYADLWETINGEGSWAANPWVFVLAFKRVYG